MKKINLVLLLLLTVITLSACGGDTNQASSTSQESQKDQAQTESQKKNEEKSTGSVGGEIGVSQDAEDGKRTKIKEKNDINIVKDSGPFAVKVDSVRIYEIEPNQDYKDYYEGKEKLTVVAISTKIEHKSEETNSIYPNQGTIVTNTKEQKEADSILSDDVGGDFIGEVIKQGTVVFLLDSQAKDINSIKYVIGGGYTSEFDSLGEDLTFEINMN